MSGAMPDFRLADVLETNPAAPWHPKKRTWRKRYGTPLTPASVLLDDYEIANQAAQYRQWMQRRGGAE